jgi:hypothetical protein
MTHLANYESRPLLSQDTSASGAAATVPLAAVKNKSHAIHEVLHVYNGGVPGVHNFTVAFTQKGAAVTLTWDTARTVNVMEVAEFRPLPLIGDENTAVVITGELLAGQTNTLQVLHS